MMEGEIDELRSKLKESESKQLAIAHLAKEILEKDKEKDQRLSILGEENLQKSRDIARLQSLLKTRDDYLADAENEVAKLRNEITQINDNKNAYTIELEHKLSSLRAQVNEKNGILYDREQEAQELKKQLALKERELEQALKKSFGETTLSQTRDSFPDSERMKLSGKVAELESERNLMVEEISQLQDKIVMISRNLDNERSHVKELSAMCNGYRRDVEELKHRCNELTSELNEYHSNTKMAKKGNSMFFEFVDERVKLEKDLLKLKAQNDFFASQKEAYECQLNELRHELMLALTLHTGKGSAGGDTSALQQEISRLRTELITLNAKLLEKCKADTLVEEMDASNALLAVNMKECAFNSLKEEVKMLAGKLERVQKERDDYFDNFRECESRYSEECGRSRELLNEVECLKRRLVLEQKKNFNSALLKTLKPSKENLAEKIVDFNEKIAGINEIDADNPTISGVQSSFSLSNCSLTSARRCTFTRLREEDDTEVAAGVKTNPIDELTPVIDQNGVQSSAFDLNRQTDTDDKEMPVEKRLKFKLPDEKLKSDPTKKDVYPLIRKPKRKIIRRVCEANIL